MLQRVYVYRSALGAVFGIWLYFVTDFLTLFQSLEAVCLDGGEVYEHVFAALVVRDESISFVCVEPFYCTLLHGGAS